MGAIAWDDLPKVQREMLLGELRETERSAATLAISEDAWDLAYHEAVKAAIAKLEASP